MKRNRLALMAILFLVCLPTYGGATGEQKHVLALISYDIRDQWSASVLEGIASAFAGADVQLHVECLDTRRHQGERYFADFTQFMTSKYRDNRLDLAIVVDNAAFDFMLRVRQAFRSDLPVVFCGINNFTPSMVSGQRGITGVNEAVDIPGTVNLALGLFPQATRLVVAGGASGVGAINLENFRKSIPAFSRKVEIQELFDIPRASLTTILKGLPGKSILLRMDNLREQDGSDTPLRQTISLLSAAASCPVFSFWDFDMGHGALGGVVVSGFTQGKKAGELALIALQGRPLESIPVVMESPNVLMLDYVQMHRFGVEDADLPHNALVINMPISFYARYKVAIWSWAIVLAFIVLCIITLLIALLARLRAEKALRESDERYRLYVNNAPAGIFITDADGRYLDVNPEACRITGYERDDLLSMTITELLVPDAMPLWQAHFAKLNVEGHATGELSYRRKDGAVRWWSVFATRISNDRFLGFANDVTERRRNEEALEENQARLTLAMDLATMVSWEMDIATNTFTFDDRFYALYGTTSAREGGHLMHEKVYAREFVHPEDAWMVADEIHNLMDANEPYFNARLEHRIVRRDGEIRHIVVRYRIIRDEMGRPIKTIGANQDITASKRTEEALKANEQRFRALLDEVDMVAVQGYDQDRRVIYWNKASERLYGYAEAEALGLNLENLIIPEPMRDAVIRDIRNWLEKGTPIASGEMLLVRKDGATVPVYSSHVMQEAASGQKELYCVDVDLTEIKKVHDQLLLAKETAESANKAKSEFLANMSHEIRTPLNGIIGMLQLLHDTPLNDEQGQFLKLAMKSSMRLTRLLSDILDIARVEAGKLQMQVEVFELVALVKQLAALNEPVSLQAGVSFKIMAHPGLPQSVLGDSIRLQQVLTNLIGNAFKFTTAGSITLEVSPHPSRRSGEAHVLFAVSDTGCGMDEIILEKLFEPFVQASQGYTRRYQGAGLGLSIVKRIVELMGGAISVESELGVGTTFFVALPFKLTPSSAAEAKKPASAERTSAQSGFRILIAEDDMVSSLAVSRLLEKKGHMIHVVRDGEKALEALREIHFDLVIMDVQMPVVDGVEATKRIRSGEAGRDKADIPIIAMTAYAMAGDREMFLAAGMNDYIAKPIDIADFLAALERVKGERLRPQDDKSVAKE